MPGATRHGWQDSDLVVRAHGEVLVGGLAVDPDAAPVQDLGEVVAVPAAGLGEHGADGRALDRVAAGPGRLSRRREQAQHGHVSGVARTGRRGPSWPGSVARP